MREILLSAAGAWVFVYMLGFVRMKRKPLSCETCMAGWFCLGLSIPYHAWYHIPFLMASSMIAVFVLNKLLHRI